ncbi:(2Fe-2S)-binding protein [Thermomonospora umbrina]|uniref:Bacterioferritin-associated ferredoxin n=1 Tax=Thermomonospora umbrina TaxID=111806 RepID=A0A3D9SRB5_9ACTN|nr:(2Fe-2S)-binding protein [Thermomonospora umbrina]REE98348.1 bacterioferritin-associated ferredoxin [Thermomonospora umbrina]
MYICICNGVTEDDVRGCVAAGACSTREVRQACGMKPGCGVCTKRLCAIVSEARTASELADAFTGGPLPLEAVSSDAPAQVGVGAGVGMTAEGGSASSTAA